MIEVQITVKGRGGVLHMGTARVEALPQMGDRADFGPDLRGVLVYKRFRSPDGPPTSLEYHEERWFYSRTHVCPDHFGVSYEQCGCPLPEVLYAPS